jgi:MerR HTH family regulatory protein
MGLFQMALKVAGRKYRTIKEVSDSYRVSRETIRRWIITGILSPPIVVRKGKRRLRYFDDAYFERLKPYFEAVRTVRSSSPSVDDTLADEVVSLPYNPDGLNVIDIGNAMRANVEDRASGTKTRRS